MMAIGPVPVAATQISPGETNATGAKSQKLEEHPEAAVVVVVFAEARVEGEIVMGIIRVEAETADQCEVEIVVGNEIDHTKHTHPFNSMIFFFFFFSI